MNKVEESYLLWLKAVRENRKLRIELMKKFKIKHVEIDGIVFPVTETTTVSGDPIIIVDYPSRPIMRKNNKYSERLSDIESELKYMSECRNW